MSELLGQLKLGLLKQWKMIVMRIMIRHKDKAHEVPIYKFWPHL